MKKYWVAQKSKCANCKKNKKNKNCKIKKIYKNNNKSINKE